VEKGSVPLLLSVLLLSNCGGRPPDTTLPPITGPSNTGLACGVERWSVKTLSDPNANTVNLTDVTTTTIKSLNLLTPHCGGGPNQRTYPEEFQVYEVVGRITLARLESDRDYHVAIADAAESSYTIVTEVADPACQGVVSSPHLQTMNDARAAWDALRAGQSLSSLPGTMVRVRGVGFYDFNHNQTGRSQSCLELHPIISIERVQ